MTHDDAIARNYRAGYYNACDGKGWQKQDDGLSVEASTHRDNAAWDEAHKRLIGPPMFVVGQTISTLAEYEALPVGAVVVYHGIYGSSVTYRKDSGGLVMTEIKDKPREQEGMPETMAAMAGLPIVIRSLP